MGAYTKAIREVCPMTEDDAERVETLMREESGGVLDSLTPRKFNALARKCASWLFNAKETQVHAEFEVSRGTADRFNPFAACTNPFIFEAKVSWLPGCGHYVHIKGDKESVRNLAMTTLGLSNDEVERGFS